MAAFKKIEANAIIFSSIYTFLLKINESNIFHTIQHKPSHYIPVNIRLPEGLNCIRVYNNIFTVDNYNTC